MWLQLLFLLLAALPPIQAQFNTFSTNYEGTRLFFTTRLIQPGSAQPAHGKVFVAEDNGKITPLFVVERIWYSPGGESGAGASNQFDAIGVSVDSHETKLAVVTNRDCNFGSPCAVIDQADSRLYDNRGNEVTAFLSRRVKLSPNGLWVLTMSDPQATWPTFSVERLGSLPVPVPMPLSNIGAAPLEAQSIANDGTAVIALTYPTKLIIFTPQKTTRILEAAAIETAIDADARTIVWTELQNGRRSLRMYLPDNEALTLVPSDEDAHGPKLSEDGKRLLFIAGEQVWIMDLASGNRRQAPGISEGVSSATLSGNGRVSWIQTTAGRLVMADVDTGTLREIIGTTPAFTALENMIVGIGQPVTIPASVRAGDHVQVSLNSTSAPVLRVADGSVTFQVPWEASTLEGGVPLSRIGLSATGTSGWAGATLQARVSTFWPAFVMGQTTSQGTHALAIHQNFEALVTPQNPAKPGEIIHLYATGLGPVTPPVATAQPAAAGTVHPMDRPMTCSISDSRVDLLYAGLAPGLIGYYQVSVRMPDTVQSSSAALRCMLQPYGPANHQMEFVSNIIPMRP